MNQKDFPEDGHDPKVVGELLFYCYIFDSLSLSNIYDIAKIALLIYYLFLSMFLRIDKKLALRK